MCVLGGGGGGGDGASRYMNIIDEYLLNAMVFSPVML